jgi:hypothetical protein
MKNRLTLFLSLGIFGVLILLFALWYVPRLALPPHWSLPLSIGWLYVTVSYLLLAAAFSTVVWFMLVRDAGDKIPPIAMMALGFMGFITYTLHLLGTIPHPPISPMFILPTTMFLSWLYIIFGVVGLLTKRRAS